MHLDGLGDLRRLRVDHLLAPKRRAALPLHLRRPVDPGLFIEALVDLAVGALERPHEGALLLPAHPHHLLGLVVAGLAGPYVGVGLVFPEIGGVDGKTLRAQQQLDAFQGVKVVLYQQHTHCGPSGIEANSHRSWE